MVKTLGSVIKVVTNRERFGIGVRWLQGPKSVIGAVAGAVG